MSFEILTFRFDFQTPEQLKFSCLAIAEGARAAGHLTSNKLSTIVDNESGERFRDRVSSSDSSDEDSGPPPLPPPRSESLAAKEVPPPRQNGIGANPEFEIPDRLIEAVNGACDHETDDSSPNSDVRALLASEYPMFLKNAASASLLGRNYHSFIAPRH